MKLVIYWQHLLRTEGSIESGADYRLVEVPTEFQTKTEVRYIPWGLVPYTKLRKDTILTIFIYENGVLLERRDRMLGFDTSHNIVIPLDRLAGSTVTKFVE